MMWNLYIGLAVNLVIVLGIYEICSTLEIIHGDGASYSTVAPAKRVVLICVDRMNGEPLFNRLERDRSPLFLKRVINESAFGFSRTYTPYSEVSGLVAMTSGTCSSPLGLLTAHCSFKPILDTVFNMKTPIYFYGNTLRSFFLTKILNTADWVSLNPVGPSLDYQDYNMYKEHLVTTLNTSVAKNDTTFIFFQMTNLQKCEMHDSDELYELDEEIEIINEAVAEVFPDNLTTFIFTSSRGHSQNHHTGYPPVDEHLTPLIAWGAGITQGYIETIKQIDICPLLSTLLGVKIPRNSQGSLPIDYLNLTDGNLRRAISVNILHIQSILEVIMNRISSGLFRKFKPHFNDTSHQLRSILNSSETSPLMTIDQLVADEAFKLKIVNRYKDAFSFFIFMCILVTAWGWNSWLFASLMMHDSPTEHVNRKSCFMMQCLINLPFIGLIVFELALVVSQKVQFYYIIYVLAPTLIWCRVFNTLPYWCKLSRKMDKEKFKSMVAVTFIYSFISALTGGFLQFHIPMALVMLILIVLYPLRSNNVIAKGWILIWTSCVIFLHIIKNVNTYIIPNASWFLVSAIAWCVMSLVLSATLMVKWRDFSVALILSLLLIVIGGVRSVISMKSHYKDPLEFYFVWVLFALIPFIAAITSNNPKHRFVNSVLSLASSFMLIAHTYELLIFLILCFIIFAWLYVEIGQSSYLCSGQKLATVYAPLFFLVYTLSAQEIMGNMDETRESDYLSTMSLSQNTPGYSIGLRLVFAIVIGECAVMCHSTLKATSTSHVFTKILVVFNFIGNQFLLQMSPHKESQNSEMVSQTLFIHTLVILVILLYPIAYTLMKLHVCVFLKSHGRMSLPLGDNSVQMSSLKL